MNQKTRVGVFNEPGPHFEPLSGPFLEGFCKGRVENRSGQNGLFYNKVKRAIEGLNKGWKLALLNSVING